MNASEPLGFGVAKDVFTNNFLFWIDFDQGHYCVPQHETQSYLVKPYRLILAEIWKCDFNATPNFMTTSQSRATLTNLERQTFQKQAQERKTWSCLK